MIVIAFSKFAGDMKIIATLIYLSPSKLLFQSLFSRRNIFRHRYYKLKFKIGGYKNLILENNLTLKGMV